MVFMDKPRHPQVIRTWKVERIRKPSPPKKALPGKPFKKSKTVTAPELTLDFVLFVVR